MKNHPFPDPIFILFWTEIEGPKSADSRSHFSVRKTRFFDTFLQFCRIENDHFLPILKKSIFPGDFRSYFESKKGQKTHFFCRYWAPMIFTPLFLAFFRTPDSKTDCYKFRLTPDWNKKVKKKWKKIKKNRVKKIAPFSLPGGMIVFFKHRFFSLFLALFL